MKDFLIVWSPLAEETYLKTLSSILESWTIKEAGDFEFKVESLLRVLKKQKQLCPASQKMKNLRRCVVTSQTSLVYQIRKEQIELVAFFDNRCMNIY